MAQSTTVLMQIQKLVPNELFDKLATKYHVDKYASVFTASTHFAVLMFAQLAGLKSTRDIQHATASLFSMDPLVNVKKSTLAEANKRINWRFYYELFQALFALFCDRFSKHDFPVPGKLLSLDSTLIPVCLERLPWAKYRTTKGALKLHTLLDHDGLIPQDIVITDGKVSDIGAARTMPITSGTTYLVDRGYFDSAWFARINRNQAFFVTRMKSNVGFEWTEKRKVEAGTGVRGDWIGHFDGTPADHYPDPLRLVHFTDPETKKELWFLTNLLEIDALTIAQLYKQRWQIELFFKWVKQNLKIKSFLGTSENAVMSQIWVAMIVFLLLRVLQKNADEAITTHQLLVFISTHLLICIPVAKAWQDFQRTSDIEKQKRKQQSRTMLN